MKKEQPMNDLLFNQTIERFKKFEEVDAIVLGGSRAYGKTDLYSDFDVYIYQIVSKLDDLLNKYM